MLKALTVDQVNKIIEAAVALKNKRPISEHGIRLSDPAAVDLALKALTDSEVLKAEIAKLLPAARAELKALMWFGRDTEENDFSAVLHEANEDRRAANDDAVYISDKAQALPLYLLEGLKKLRS